MCQSTGLSGSTVPQLSYQYAGSNHEGPQDYTRPLSHKLQWKCWNRRRRHEISSATWIISCMYPIEQCRKHHRHSCKIKVSHIPASLLWKKGCGVWSQYKRKCLNESVEPPQMKLKRRTQAWIGSRYEAWRNSRPEDLDRPVAGSRTGSPFLSYEVLIDCWMKQYHVLWFATDDPPAFIGDAAHTL